MLDDLKHEITELFHDQFFRNPELEDLPPLFERGADRSGVRINGRVCVFWVESTTAPLFRVVLSSEVPAYVNDFAEMLCECRRSGGTLLLEAEELLRVLVHAETAYLTENHIAASD